MIKKNEKKFFNYPFVLSVGRLNSQKNYELLINIFKNIVKNKGLKITDYIYWAMEEKKEN